MLEEVVEVLLVVVVVVLVLVLPVDEDMSDYLRSRVHGDRLDSGLLEGLVSLVSGFLMR